MPKVQQYRKQATQKSVVAQTQLPKPPEIPAEPTKQDKICNWVFVGVLTTGVVTLISSCYFLSQGFVAAFKHSPLDWLSLIGCTVLSALLGVVVRGLIWMAFAGTTMLATHLKAFHAQEKISNLALKYKKFFPGDTSWAAQAKLGLMVNRQQFKDIIVFGTQEYDAAKKKDQALAPLCAYVGMAHQYQNDAHSAILWNERAVELFEKAMVPLQKVTPESKVPNREIVDGMILQYASAYANLGSNYFSVNNYGKAKKNFNLALEQLNRVKNSAHKDMLVRGINEHLSRIKHW